MTAPGAGAENRLLPVRPLHPTAPADAPLREATNTDAGSGADARSAGSAVRTVLALVASLAAGVVGVLLVRHGIRTDEFPPFLDGASNTPITGYSGPWITAGAGAVLLAALFLVSAIVDGLRWSRSRPGAAAT